MGFGLRRHPAPLPEIATLHSAISTLPPAFVARHSATSARRRQGEGEIYGIVAAGMAGVAGAALAAGAGVIAAGALEAAAGFG
jgi:hypothetical protein